MSEPINRAENGFIPTGRGTAEKPHQRPITPEVQKMTELRIFNSAGEVADCTFDMLKGGPKPPRFRSAQPTREYLKNGASFTMQVDGRGCRHSFQLMNAWSASIIPAATGARPVKALSITAAALPTETDGHPMPTPTAAC